MWSSQQDSEILKTFKKFYVQLIEHFTSLRVTVQRCDKNKRFGILPMIPATSIIIYHTTAKLELSWHYSLPPLINKH